MFRSLVLPCVFAASLTIVASSAKQIPLGAGPAQHVNTKSHQTITPELSSYLQGLLDRSDVPGLSVGVVRLSGKREVEKEYGAWGNMTEDGNKVTHDTLFNIGSCSKAFLSAAVGILIDDFAQGKNVTVLPPKLRTFTWDTKIKHLLPEWNLVDEWATEKANVKDILSHVSGLPRHDASYAPGDTVSDMIHKMQHLRPVCELRERWYYNNQVTLLGHLMFALH
ncbi:hypothetical protein PHLCEN_2v12048 [Hermanssonia centrifuga]|uniref:Beta-lactamase-related domain-containing protein n=1 Tax=Hermanssonia centrifuga TaxID=98765 RepID=A0A2R6NI46_9APHY|nr:hypothetical protein PHLCEN_2v12048 [Hermanssonia centrifuga]